MKGTIRKRGDTWTYQFMVPDPRREGGRRTISKGGYRLRREAEAALAEALASFDDQAHVEPSKLTLTACVEGHWLPSLHRLKPATVRGYQDQMAYYVLPHIGGLRLRDITASDIGRLYVELRTNGRRKSPGGLGESSMSKVHVALSKSLGDAVEEGLLARSPMVRLPKRIRPSQGQREEMRVWSAGEMGRFLDHAEDDRLYGLFRLVLATGLRRSEAAGLRWEDVDLDGGRLSVRRGRVLVATPSRRALPRPTALGPSAWGRRPSQRCGHTAGASWRSGWPGARRGSTPAWSSPGRTARRCTPRRCAGTCAGWPRWRVSPSSGSTTCATAPPRTHSPTECR
jgi:integrase